MTPKQYIQSRPALNWTELARSIDWSKSSFHQWMTGLRGIPKDKEEILIEVLKNYGY